MLSHAWDAARYERMPLGIRGVRLTALRVEAEVKDDRHNPVAHGESVAGAGDD